MHPIWLIETGVWKDQNGGINSAGLYRCELLPVVQAMNDIAERDFRHWKGQP
jgi:hypothetical protein